MNTRALRQIHIKLNQKILKSIFENFQTKKMIDFLLKEHTKLKIFCQKDIFEF
jgi:hypothetical protein